MPLNSKPQRQLTATFAFSHLVLFRVELYQNKSCGLKSEPKLKTVPNVGINGNSNSIMRCSQTFHLFIVSRFCVHFYISVVSAKTLPCFLCK